MRARNKCGRPPFCLTSLSLAPPLAGPPPLDHRRHLQAHRPPPHPSELRLCLRQGFGVHVQGLLLESAHLPRPALAGAVRRRRRRRPPLWTPPLNPCAARRPLPARNESNALRRLPAPGTDGPGRPQRVSGTRGWGGGGRLCKALSQGNRCRPCAAGHGDGIALGWRSPTLRPPHTPLAQARAGRVPFRVQVRGVDLQQEGVPALLQEVLWQALPLRPPPPPGRRLWWRQRWPGQLPTVQQLQEPGRVHQLLQQVPRPLSPGLLPPSMSP